MGALGLLPPSLWAKSSFALDNKSESFLIGDGFHSESNSLITTEPVVSVPGAARWWTPGVGLKDIALPFLPHSFSANPYRPHIVFTTEKWGRQAAAIDLIKGEVKLLSNPPGRRFFGHSIWHPNGLFICATQMNDETSSGQVRLISTSDWTLGPEHNTGGAYPHDCQWQANTPCLVVMNGNSKVVHGAEIPMGKSSLVWINPFTGQIVKRRSLLNSRGGFNHFAQGPNGLYIVTGSEDRLDLKLSRPLISLVRADGTAVHLRPRNPLQLWTGEALNVTLDETKGLVAATFPQAGSLNVWNYLSAEHVNVLAIDEPRCVLQGQDEGTFWVSNAQTREWINLTEEFEMRALKKRGLASQPMAEVTGGRGSHALRLPIAVS